MDMNEYLEKYLDEFGEGFPMIPLAWGRSEQEVIDLVKKCLQEKKTVYDLGILADDDDMEY